MNKLSCFDCLKCIGFHETSSGVALSNPLEVDEQTLEETSALLETMICEPEAPIDIQAQAVLITEETSGANPYGQPKEESYIIARFDGKKEHRYICCLKSVRNNEMTAFIRFKIQNRRILRVIPFDLEVVEKE
ncbi:unnamed protein product [Nezara viridula]|uniref:Uncharacterized protein n=1 Tax=Nezara viridula TaxID=85310 RepID=A0A9P0E7L8_NEZVI|nr:unnamed protein product [Nezara viridula]